MNIYEAIKKSKSQPQTHPSKMTITARKELVKISKDLDKSRVSSAVLELVKFYKENNISWSEFVTEKYEYFTSNFEKCEESDDYEHCGFFRREFDYNGSPKPVRHETAQIEFKLKGYYGKPLPKDEVRLFFNLIEIGIFKKQDAVQFVSSWLKSFE